MKLYELPGISCTIDGMRKICSNGMLWPLLITVLFFAVGVFVIERHELWFDESQAWLMAKASANIPELFEHLKGERHQILWYLCLFSITRFSHDPFAMQFFHLLIASATVFLIACFAPFPIWIKLPLICSYFFAYEYCVVSRNYALGVFLVFLFCTLNNRETKPVLAQILVLCLLSNTNAFGLLLAIALAATMLFERVLARGKPFSELIAKRNLVLVLVLLLSFSLAIFQLIRVKSWTGTYKDWIRYKCDRPDKKLVATRFIHTYSMSSEQSDEIRVLGDLNSRGTRKFQINPAGNEYLEHMATLHRQCICPGKQ